MKREISMHCERDLHGIVVVTMNGECDAGLYIRTLFSLKDGMDKGYNKEDYRIDDKVIVY